MAEITRFTTVPHTTTALPARTAPRDYERALLLGAFAAELVAAYFHAGLAGFASPELAPMLLPGIVGAALVAWKARAWAFGVAGALLAFLPLVVLLGFGGVKELGSPATGASYTSLLFLLLALVLTLPAAVAGVRRARARAQPPEPGWRFGLTLLTATFLFGAMVVGGLASEQAAEGAAAGGYDFAPAESVHIAAQGFAYGKPSGPVAAGHITELVVENKDSAFHTFTYAAGGKTYSHDLPGGATARFLVKFDQAGSVAYWCEPHSSGPDGARTGMTGQLGVA